MSFNFATVWEALAASIPDADAVISGDLVRSWGEFEERAAGVAGGLATAGVSTRENVGLCLYNGPEYSEAQFGVFKQRATPFNINYRYGAAELADLLTDSDAVAVFYDATLADRFEEIHASLPNVKLFVQVDQGEGPAPAPVPTWAIDYEALAGGSARADVISRSPDDIWMLFTGGTTGKPKGVMWPHRSMVENMKPNYAGLKHAVPRSVEEAVEAALEIRSRGHTPRQLPAAPLMHGTGGIGALSTFTMGGAVLTLPGHSFSGDALWETVQRHRATLLTIVGDAFSRPMLESLDAAAERGTPWDLSSVFLILSSGVMWSAPVKEALLEHNPRMRLLDSLGSSEGIGFASKLESKDETASTARFVLGEFTKVFTEDGREIVPGSGERGRLALGGALPLGYYKDPVKSAETWPEIGGQRYSIPGDWATVEDDGSIVLLGRGSVCINSGGEKIYPEEVEEAVKLHPGVVDCNVVGVPDERWGQAITAVVELSDASVSDADIVATVKNDLAAFKAPKHIVRVEKLLRGPNGKSDYKWASKTALEAVESASG